jgi:hypothetical protein
MSDFMKAIQGYHLIKPENFLWRPSNLMRIPNADYLERTGSENLGAWLRRLPPRSGGRKVPRVYGKGASFTQSLEMW